MEPHQSPHPPSPNTPSSSSGGGGGSSNNNKTSTPAAAPHSPHPPLTPKSVPRTDANPYPTTFIQADATSFKQVVQMLTGSAETAAKAASPMPPKTPAPPAARPPGPNKPSFKLYERRGSFRHLKMINPLSPSFTPGCSPSPRKQQSDILSPSMLDLPSLVLSPVTPLIPDPFHRCSAASEEERVIAEKGFYLHPSPRSATPRDGHPPRLLPLFPLTSPRVSAAAGGSP